MTPPRDQLVEQLIKNQTLKCYLLIYGWTDWDETLGVYRVDLEIMQRHIFDFRSEVQTGSEPSPYDIGIISARNFT